MSRILNIVFIILRVVIGSFFLFSAITKLSPIEYFELQLVSDHLASWGISGVVARVVIGLEFFLGACFIINIDRKKIVTRSAIALLSAFTAYLFISFLLRGNEANCNCFGSIIKVSTIESIIKNIVLLILLGLTHKYHEGYQFRFPRIIISSLLVVGIGIVFIVNPLNKTFISSTDTDKVDYPIDVSYLYTDTIYKKPMVDLMKGKHVLICLSMHCPHCKLCALKVGIMKRQCPSLPFYFLLNGDKEDLAGFYDETKSQDIPYNIVLGERFINISGFNLPAIFFIDNAVVKRKLKYPDLTQQSIDDWLKE